MARAKDDGIGDGVPCSVWSGSFRVFGVDVKCHVLDDGRRIIEAESFGLLLQAMQAGAEPGDLDGLVRFEKGLPLPE